MPWQRSPIARRTLQWRQRQQRQHIPPRQVMPCRIVPPHGWLVSCGVVSSFRVVVSCPGAAGCTRGEIQELICPLGSLSAQWPPHGLSLFVRSGRAGRVGSGRRRQGANRGVRDRWLGRPAPTYHCPPEPEPERYLRLRPGILTARAPAPRVLIGGGLVAV